MTTGNRSYQQPNDSDPQYYWMTHDLGRLMTDWNIKVSRECKHLLENMLKIDPRARLTMDEVLSHPWFKGPEEPPPSHQGGPLHPTL
jgi:serine/threonine protein kinase